MEKQLAIETRELEEWQERKREGHLRPGEVYVPLEWIPDWQRIAKDLLATTGRTLEAEGHGHPTLQDMVELRLTFDGIEAGSIGTYRGSSSLAQHLAEFADVLCEQFLHEEIWGGWPTSPIHHTHPLDPNVNEHDVAVWSCPQGAFSISIGELREVGGKRK